MLKTNDWENNIRVFKTKEELKELQEMLDIKSFENGDIFDGIQLFEEKYIVEARLVCECVEVKY